MMNLLKKLTSKKNSDLTAIAQRGAVIIDVRNPDEYLAGNVRGTVNIPLGNIPSKIEKIKSYQKPVITCCVSGTRSGLAAAMLKAKGIEVYNGVRWENMEALVEARMKKKL